MYLAENLQKKSLLDGIHYCECCCTNRHPPTGSTQQVKPGIYWGKNVVDGGVDTGGVGTLNRCWWKQRGENIGIYYIVI